MAGRGKRKIAQLQPGDFPGVETVAFDKWRESAAKYEPLAWTVYIGILIVVPLVFIAWSPLPDAPVILKIPGFALILFAVLLGSVLLITREPRALAKQAGITPEAIKEARKRFGPIMDADSVGAAAPVAPAAPVTQDPSTVLTQAASQPTATPATPPVPPPVSGSPYGSRPSS